MPLPAAAEVRSSVTSRTPSLTNFTVTVRLSGDHVAGVAEREAEHVVHRVDAGLSWVGVGGGEGGQQQEGGGERAHQAAIMAGA